MRLLYFTERDSPHDQRFLAALANTPHQVFALRQYETREKTFTGMTELHWQEGQPDWTDWRGWQEGKAQLQHILVDLQPDLIHAGPIQGPAFLTALTGFHPLLSMSWGSDLLIHAHRSPWMRCATRYTLSQSEILLADCQTVADEAVKLGLSSDKIVRFPWGVDLDHFSPSHGAAEGIKLRKNLGWEDAFIVLCNRSWSPLYGVDLLAKAFTEASKRNPSLRLLLVGDGPQSEEIRQLLAPVAEKVSLPGWLDRKSLPGVYCAADLFVSPSHSDGSSISLLEAMACSRPVLASDIPGNREWITPGVTGELFEDGNLESLTGQILKMADSPELRAYGEQARKLAEERANWQENFKKLSQAYQRVMQL